MIYMSPFLGGGITLCDGNKQASTTKATLATQMYEGAGVYIERKGLDSLKTMSMFLLERYPLIFRLFDST